ncbi:site-specific integrase [Mycobacterium innocens]|uniref:site-specific integrase n=1 Tax=Mycobacterium innocens TaxID=2341083 RepID=UPI001ABEF110|nr:site-specific integrase [Mycobacterium innocens]
MYLSDLATPLESNDPLWWTLRRRDHGGGLTRHQVDYEALRAVFRRANQQLGTNWSMHDLRHTAAVRMSRDQLLTMRDVQAILGHAHLSTTADIYTEVNPGFGGDLGCELRFSLLTRKKCRQNRVCRSRDFFVGMARITYYVTP